jgi:hypothetical protein
MPIPYPGKPDLLRLLRLFLVYISLDQISRDIVPKVFLPPDFNGDEFYLAGGGHGRLWLGGGKS